MQRMTETKPLLQVTLELLAKCTEKPKAIAAGAGVQYAWLMKLRANEIPNPGICGIQKLHDYLTRAQ